MSGASDVKIDELYSHLKKWSIDNVVGKQLSEEELTYLIASIAPFVGLLVGELAVRASATDDDALISASSLASQLKDDLIITAQRYIRVVHPVVSS